jgi:hypothetical protein
MYTNYEPDIIWTDRIRSNFLKNPNTISRPIKHAVGEFDTNILSSYSHYGTDIPVYLL